MSHLMVPVSHTSDNVYADLSSKTSLFIINYFVFLFNLFLNIYRVFTSYFISGVIKVPIFPFIAFLRLEGCFPLIILVFIPDLSMILIAVLSRNS